MSVQTYDSKKVNDLCPTALKAENEVQTDSAKFSKPDGESEMNDASGMPSTAIPPTANDATAICINGNSSSFQKSSVQTEVRQREMIQNPQQLSRDVPFSLDGNFCVQPLFLQVIRKVNGVDPSKTVFTYKEVCSNIIIIF
jgi:hypothetical protein